MSVPSLYWLTFCNLLKFLLESELRPQMLEAFIKFCPLEHVTWTSHRCDTLYRNPCVTWQLKLGTGHKKHLPCAKVALWREVNSGVPLCVIWTTECDLWYLFIDRDYAEQVPSLRDELWWVGTRGAHLSHAYSLEVLPLLVASTGFQIPEAHSPSHSQSCILLTDLG